LARRNVTNTAPALKSWTGADDALAEIRALDAKIDAKEAAKAEALQALQQTHDRDILPLVEKRDALGKAIEDYVTMHQDDLVDRRSKMLNHGTVGFRLGQPAVKAQKGWTLKKAVEALEIAKKRVWIAVKKSVDKVRILKDKPDADVLKKFGLEIVQEERVYYDTSDTATVNPEAEAA